MWRSLILAGLFASSIVLTSAAGQEIDPSSIGDVLLACEAARATGGSDQEPVLGSSVTTGVPSGLSLTMLAEIPAAKWPKYSSGLVLTAHQVTLEPQASMAMSRRKGPRLLYVEAGTIAVSINSQAQPHGVGSGVLVETDQNYLIRNETAENAAVVSLEVDPSIANENVGYGDIAQLQPDNPPAALGPPAEPLLPGDEGEPTRELPVIISHRLLTAAILPQTERAPLFLACLSWSDPAFDTGELFHPGPVGLLVLQGELRVGDSARLGVGECVVFQPHERYRLRASDPSPVVLMAGIAPAETPFWNDAAAQAPGQLSRPLSWSCGQEEDAASVSAAAPEVPRLMAVRARE
jgi:quercetin dioxygenase-like cupin family protein